MCLERGLYVFEEEIAIVACYIAERHIGVEESESIALVVGKLLIENGVEVFVVERCTTSGKVVAYFVREG
jgi:predicted NUDIX family phosphoesterase